MCSWILRYPRMETSQPPLYNLFQCLTIPTVKKVLSCVQVEYHYLQFVPIAFCPVDGTTEKSLAPSSSFSPYIDKIQSDPSLFQAKQSQLSALLHKTHIPDPPSPLWPCTVLSPVCLSFSCTGKPRAQHSRCSLTSAKERTPRPTC